MSAVDAIRSTSVNFWNTDFIKKESINSNGHQSSLFLTQDKKFKNLQLSSALSGADSNKGTKQKGNNPEAKQLTKQNQNLDLEELRFFKFGNLY